MKNSEKRWANLNEIDKDQWPAKAICNHASVGVNEKKKTFMLKLGVKITK